jgi:drug/metabolite transporter (DMT)-like permease
LALSGAIGFLLAFDLWAWHQSILYIGPGLSTILGNLEVIIMAAFGILFLRERLTGRFAAAVAIAMVGLFLMFGLDWSQLGSDYRIGILLGFAVAIMYAAVLIGLRSTQMRADSLDPIATMAWVSMTTAVTLAFWIGGSGGTFAIPDSKTGGALVAYALVSHAVGWIMITGALPRVQASRAGLLLLIQPSLAFVWDVLLFDRPTRAIELVGAVMALGAIYLGSTRRSENSEP